MAVRAAKATNRPLPAERLLDVAADLFDREGIRAVGIERLIAEADVARASLYQSFGSKDALVVAYLERADRADRVRYAQAVKALGTDPAGRVAAFFRLAAAGMRRRRFRGCLYVNAATEFPDATHPVHAVVVAHRRWQHAEFAAAARQAGAVDPQRLATRLQLLYDGALVGAKADHEVGPLEEAATLAAELLSTR
ncbi:TetR family transcriptional regulator [Pseudonocardia sp. NPDC049154]|uniref:TetR/AcrR family transcriptional regulator n=1 Tax=Pseudonocardia sp. NPDC049154 TaxID=3155501 RepID=UPI0033C1F38E